MIKKHFYKIIIRLFLFLGLVYGLGRIYYAFTAGFSVSEISSTIPYNKKFEIEPLTAVQQEKLHAILAQNYTYLGKGCQSYVFGSDDGGYVIKFLKYKHFTPQKWLYLFSFIPAIDNYRLKKIEVKEKKLDDIFSSWKIAYEELQKETGILYVHLNKTTDLQQKISIIDKLGFTSLINADEYEFLIQKRAKSFTKTLEDYMKSGNVISAKKLIDQLFAMVVTEYQAGVGDNDHALMQNTGVLEHLPIHVDVGQFVKKESFKDKLVQDQELFNKTYKFKVWLKKRYPELADHLHQKLYTFMGSKVNELSPRLKSVSCEEL